MIKKEIFVYVHILKRINKKPKLMSKNNKNVYSSKACKDCANRNDCTKSKNGRKLYLSVNKEQIDDYFELMKSAENRTRMLKRKEIIEHPFGTIKRNWGFNYFMQRGLKKVKAEFSFICFIYNLKRVLNIVPMNKLMATLNE